MKLPARFRDDRIFLHPITVDGTELTFYTDSGGGGMFISRATVARLHLTPERRVINGREMDVVPPPAFREDVPLPMGVHVDVLILREDVPRDQGDGFLGQSWFADRVWRFDYLRQELALLDAWEPPSETPDHACALGFQTTGDGRRNNAFPRIRAEIDGEVLDFLFDTGATVSLTPRALSVLNGDAALRGTSFITETVLRRWHQRHPAWEIVERADARYNEVMIRVPVVRIAGYEVGPVWFVRREDHNFHDYMSQWMDKRIEGALGGSLLKYFSVTVDYPRAMAYFRTAPAR